ncbi:hypothetical protein [Streptomyces sp. AGS-58]|uniref:hypothetical protein n=1 Tax=unclassified Streptomyces TaxID=2593676 RepID=UPI0035A39AE7
MSAVPTSAEPAGVQPAVVAAPASGRLGAGEAAVVITAIAAVTVLAVLERPIPAVLSVLTAAAGLLLVGARAGRLLAAICSGRRQPRVSRRSAGLVELARLRDWLRAARGQRTFESLARRAGARRMPISVCTLRRTLDGRLPTLRTVRAFARGAGADEEEAGRVRAAAEAAVRPRPVGKPAAYVPGYQITTRAGLARAMEKVRAVAGGPSLRQLAASPAAAGLLSRSALHNMLKGLRLSGEGLLAAFAAACGAGEETTLALLAARARILTGLESQARAGYPCGIVEEIADEAEERRARDAAVRYWIPEEDEADEFDRQLHDEEEAEHRRMAAWVDSLTDDELKELEQARSAAGAGRDLHAELAAYLPR